MARASLEEQLEFEARCLERDGYGNAPHLMRMAVLEIQRLKGRLYVQSAAEAGVAQGAAAQGAQAEGAGASGVRASGLVAGEGAV